MHTRGGYYNAYRIVPGGWTPNLHAGTGLPGASPGRIRGPKIQDNLIWFFKWILGVQSE